jgi:hypothetical protein
MKEIFYINVTYLRKRLAKNEVITMFIPQNRRRRVATNFDLLISKIIASSPIVVRNT